jgi:DNA (cytosine-5)-methyltransferase 1
VDLVRQHKNGHPVFPEKVDIVTGGFPCQDFSLAGKRNGFLSHKDHKGQLKNTDTPSVETRGALYMWMKEVIEITKPKVFVAENVKGLVNLANVKDIIQQDFSQSDGDGYHVFNALVLQAADYGVPQSRERVFFIGLRKSALRPDMLPVLQSADFPGDFLPFPAPTHAASKANANLHSHVKSGLIFKDLPEPELADDPSQQYYSKAKYMGKHCQGQTEVNLNGLAPTIRSEHHGNIEFRRLSPFHGGKYQDEFEKNDWKERRLTPRECALLQTFPPDFPFVQPSGKNRFTVSTSAAYKMIGNAVPPLLAYHIARRIQSLWEVYFTADS